MGAVAARRVARRPRWRAYLLLARVSNLPTVWTNVLAGMLASQGFVDAATLTRIGLAVSLFYSGGINTFALSVGFFILAALMLLNFYGVR